jgi:asparagine synthase (glutamine-hydrolysing)
MSGISGVLQLGNPKPTAASLAFLAKGLSTGHAEWKMNSEAGVAVCSRFATQQLYENESVLIACDADLYNEDELFEYTRPRQQSIGEAGTAALIAALYERFGCDCFAKLRGAFSILIWDRRKMLLVSAVDHFGINRLVYYQDDEVFLMSSRIDAILQFGSVPREINARAIAQFLNFGVNLAPQTIFSRVQRLMPGCMLVASAANVRISKYWDMRYGVENGLNTDQLSAELESVVERSVAAHCGSDSPASLGAYLSGGTDSSTVVGMMTRKLREPVQAFSIGFEEQPFNELGYAELAARKFNARHHTYIVGPNDCFEMLPEMTRHFDEPFGNSSAIPTYFCARLAAQHGVKVLLAGDGGDELFAGNERYLTDKIFQLYQGVPLAVRKGFVEPVLGIAPFRNGLVGKARNYVKRSNIPGLERFFSYNFLCAHSPAEIFEDGFLRELADYSVLETPRRYYSEAAAGDHLDRLLYVDLKITLGDSDLPKVTCMSELAGIRTRFPFLSLAVAEFSGRIPPGLKVKGFEKRYLFKRAFRELLPPEIMQKKKHGFGIPVSVWLKSDQRFRELSHDVLRSARARERGYFRREFIDELFRKHDADDSTYYGDSLWSFLVLELWHRAFVDSPTGVAL